MTKSGKIKKKDPHRPKRPTSAYFFYAQRMREEAARKGQSITRVAEWTKEISGYWRALSPTERAPFEKMAAADKARYDAQMKIYKGKDEDKPKKPQSSYFMFLAEFRLQKKDQLDHKEVLRKAGEKWREMTDADKIPYEKLANIEKQKYDVAMKEYHAKKAASGSANAMAMHQQRQGIPMQVPMQHPQQQQLQQHQMQQLQQQQQHVAAQQHAAAQQHHHQQQQAAAMAAAADKNGEADEDDDEYEDDEEDDE